MPEEQLFKENSTQEEGRKWFPHKGLNIAFGVLFGIIGLAIVGALVYVYVL